MAREIFSYTYAQLVLLMANKADFIDCLMEIGLISPQKSCPLCNDLMKLCIPGLNSREEGRWRCSKRTCRKELSVRHGSVFEKNKISLVNLVSILFLWGKSYTSLQILRETLVSNKSVNQWLLFLREIIDDFYFLMKQCLVELEKS